MIEAVSTSETSVNFYQTTRRNNPENSHLQRCSNLKYATTASFRNRLRHILDETEVGIDRLMHLK
jgi:hypothetical protein